MVLEEVGCRPQMEHRFFVFGNRGIDLLSFGEINISKMKDCSNYTENCFLREKNNVDFQFLDKGVRWMKVYDI